MTKTSRRILYWAPRGLCILYIAFLSMFALDVFQEGRGVWQTVLALSIHLIPSFALAIVLALAWRWEWIGAAAFAGAALLYVFNMPKHLPPQARPMVALIIAGPAFAIAALFLANWMNRAALHPKR